MAVLTYQLPDGRIHRIRISGETPTSTEQTRINARLAELSGQGQAARSEAAPGFFGDLGAGFSSGVQSAQAGLYGLLQGIGHTTGWDWLEQTGEAGRERNLEEAAAALPDPVNITDNFGRGIAQAIGQSLPITIATLAGAVGGTMVGGPVGTIAGGAAVAAPIFAGQNINRQIEAGNDPNLLTAVATAIPQALLESVVDKFTLGIGQRIGGTRVVQDLLQNGLVERVGGVIARVGESAVAEAPTELAQQMLERLQAGLPMDSEDAIEEYRQALIGGAAVGGALGGGRGTFDAVTGNARRRRLAELEERKAREIAEDAGRLERYNPPKEPEPPPLTRVTDQSGINTRLALPKPTTISQDGPQGFTTPGVLPSEQTIRPPIDPAVAARAQADKLPPLPNDHPITQKLARANEELVVVKKGIQDAENALDEANINGDMDSADGAAEIINELKDRQRTVEKRLNKYVNEARKIKLEIEENRLKTEIPGETDFTETEYETAKKLVEDTGTYNPMALAKATGLKLSQIGKLRDRMVARGVLVGEKGKYHPSNQISNNRRPLQVDLPKGDLTSFIIRKRKDTDGNEVYGIYANSVNTTGPKEQQGVLPPSEGALISTHKTAEEAREEYKRLARETEGEGTSPPVTKGGVSEPAAQASGGEAASPSSVGGTTAGRPGYRTRDQRRQERIEQVKPIYLAMRRYLNGLGLNDIGLKLTREIDLESKTEGGDDLMGEGLYHNKVITLADSVHGENLTLTELIAKLRGVLTHEIIHALKALDLFTPAEWANLEKFVLRKRKVKDGKARSYTYYEWAKSSYKDYEGYKGMTPEELESTIKEEAIAEAFRDWATDRSLAPDQIGGLFNRIVRLFKQLATFLSDRRRTAQDAELTLKKILSGEVGARERKPETLQDAEVAAGKPSLAMPAFKAWFGASKVVNAQGEPLVVYHGTSKDADFSSFKIGNRGAFFTSSKAEASDYSQENDSMDFKIVNEGGRYTTAKVNTASRVMPVYLSIENPYYLTDEDWNEYKHAKNYKVAQAKLAEKAKRLGHDGINYRGGVWVVFDPTQIKSAIGNRGTFDKTKKDIRYSIKVVASTKPIGRITEHEDLGDLPKTVSEGTDLPNDIRSYLMGLTRKNAVEYVVAIAKDGSLVAHGKGNKDNTGMTERFENALRFDSSNPIVIHHTHPDDSILSPQDIGSSVWDGVTSIIAHGTNGSYSRVRSLAPMKALERKPSNGKMKPSEYVAYALYDAGDPLSRLLAQEEAKGRISNEESRNLWVLGLNLIAADAKYVELEHNQDAAEKYLRSEFQTYIDAGVDFLNDKFSEVGDYSSGNILKQYVISSDRLKQINSTGGLSDAARQFGDMAEIPDHSTESSIEWWRSYQLNLAGGKGNSKEEQEARKDVLRRAVFRLKGVKYALQEHKYPKGDKVKILQDRQHVKDILSVEQIIAENPLPIKPLKDWSEAELDFLEAFNELQDFAFTDTSGTIDRSILHRLSNLYSSHIMRAETSAYADIPYEALPDVDKTEQLFDEGGADSYNKAKPAIAYARAAKAPVGTRVPPVRDVGKNFTYNNVAPILAKVFGRFSSDQEQLKYKMEGIVEYFQDKMVSVGDLIDRVKAMGGVITDDSDAYMLAEFFSSAAGHAIKSKMDRGIYKTVIDNVKKLNFTESDRQSLGKVSELANKFITSSTYTKSGGFFKKDIGPNLPLFDLYLYARHAPHRNRQMREIEAKTKDEDGKVKYVESGLPDEDAALIVDWFKKHKKYPELLKAEASFREIIRDTNRVRKAAGLVPPDFDDGDATLYVPLRGFLDEDIDADENYDVFAKTARGFQIRGREDFKALGRGRLASNILAHAILQNEEAEIRSAKNKVGQAFLKMVRDNAERLKDFAYILKHPPTTRTMVNGKVRFVVDPKYKNDKNALIVKEGGKEVVIMITDDRIATAMKDTIYNPDTQGVLVGALTKLNRFLAAMRTVYNPEFFISNWFKDFLTSQFNINQYEIDGIAKEVRKNLKSAWKEARIGTRDPLQSATLKNDFEEFAKLGGVTEFYGLRSLTDTVKTLNNNFKEDIAGPGAAAAAASKKVWTNVWKFVSDYNTVFENVTRVAVFKAMKAKGFSPERAAQAAKNITVNFNKGGKGKTLFNAAYLFYNASIQGTFGILNAAARSKKVRRIIGYIIAAGFVQDAIMSILGGEDDDGEEIYDKIPDYQLEHSMIFLDPFGFTERGYFAIPMPYGFNAFFNAGRNAAKYMRGASTPGEFLGSLVGTTVDAFNPIGGTNSFLNFMAPTVLDPFIDIANNEDFAGRPIMPEQNIFGLPQPTSQLYWNNTHPLYVGSAQLASRLTGGTTVIPGGVEISPEHLQYWIEYIFGGVGSFIRRVSNMAFTTIPDMIEGNWDDISINDVPGFRKFYGNITSREDTEQFITNRNSVLYAEAEIEAARESGDIGRLQAAIREYPEEIGLINIVTRLNNQRTAIRRRITSIQDSDLTPAQKRDMIRILRDQENMIVGQANSIMGRLN